MKSEGLLMPELHEDVWLLIFGKVGFQHWNFEIAPYCMPVSKGFYSMGFKLTSKILVYQESNMMPKVEPISLD